MSGSVPAGMIRLNVDISRELHECLLILTARRDIYLGSYLEELLRKHKPVKEIAAEKSIKFPERRQRGRPPSREKTVKSRNKTVGQ